MRQEYDKSTHIPHLLSDRLRPVYATIPHYESEGECPIVNLLILRSNLMEDHLTINQVSMEPCEAEDCIFLRRIHEAQESADDAENELWKWVHSQRELYWRMGREDDGTDEDNGYDGADGDVESYEEWRE